MISANPSCQEVYGKVALRPFSIISDGIREKFKIENVSINTSLDLYDFIENILYKLFISKNQSFYYVITTSIRISKSTVGSQFLAVDFYHFFT